jgi:hypothetical protein
MKYFTVTLFFTLLLSYNLAAQQTYTYSYVDPCTGILKSINVPLDGVTVNYFGQMNTFQPQDFTNGNFNQWATGVYNSFGGSNPCGSILGVNTTVSIAQSSAINTLNILNSLSTVSDIQSSAFNTNVVTSVTNNTDQSNTHSDEANSENNEVAGTSGNSNDVGGGGNSTSTSQGSGTSNNEQSNTTNIQSENSELGNGELTSNQPEQDLYSDDEKTNILGGTTSSVDKSTENSETQNGAPTIVLSSDFAGFNFIEDEVSFGGKATGGYTSLRWDGKRTHGLMFDYTSMVGPNITGFYGFIGESRIDLISISGTASFIGRGSLYATVAVGQMWDIKKIKNLKVVYMLTASSGNVFGERFTGTASIVGGMYDFKVSKRIDVKLTTLYIYAPYISYYDDIVLNSPHVILPLIGTNIGITKKFKFNLNIGGTYAIGQNIMNFTIMSGARFAL